LAKKNIAGKIPWNKDTLLPDNVEEEEQCELAEIIHGCRENNPSSQERLYKKFYGYAMGVALTYCSAKEDADEVVNDSFIKVFRHINTYMRTEPFIPWLRKIVVNTSIDKSRSNKRFNHVADLDETGQLSEVDIHAELNAKQIYKLLNELPDLLRFVFNMYEIEGYSHKEIAKRLAIAESSSRTYLTRAKYQLRQLYKNLFMEEK
jgi:RNA polymerase sigma factor (sigma-70 family)